jgi:hypothetical protein
MRLSPLDAPARRELSALSRGSFQLGRKRIHKFLPAFQM